MNQATLKTWTCRVGLLIGLALVGCDSGGADGKAPEKQETKAEDVKADGDAKSDAKGENADEKADAKADEKAADAGGDEAADADGDAGGEDEGGDEESAGDEKADEGGDEKAADDGKKEAAKPKKDDGDAKAGKPLYMKKCKSCHGDDGKGKTKMGEKLGIESLARTKMPKTKIIKVINDGIPDTKMKSFKGKLSDAEIKQVAAFVKTL